MTSLAVQTQGIGAVTADNLNTFLQNAVTVAQVRNLVGQTGMAVCVDGTTAAGDGGFGFFYWNATGTAADDNGVTTIKPPMAAQGEWTRMPFPGGGGGGSICTSIANSFQYNNAGSFGCNAGVISTRSGAGAWGKSIDEIDFSGVTAPGGVAQVTTPANTASLSANWTVQLGNSGTSGAGGRVTINAGIWSGSSAQTGGFLIMDGGSVNAGVPVGGRALLSGGYGGQTNAGSIQVFGEALSNGSINLLAGGNNTVFGGQVNIQAGVSNDDVGLGQGGQVFISGGASGGGGGAGANFVANGHNQNIGGSASVQGGNGNLTSPGGAVNIIAGTSGTGVGSKGGNVIIEAGPSGGGSGVAGQVVMDTLPTADPHINGALWRSGGGGGVSGTLMVSTG